MKNKKKKIMKKFKQNFGHIYFENYWSDFLRIWYVDLPAWRASLPQILLFSGKRSRSYIGMKITVFFLPVNILVV